MHAGAHRRRRVSPEGSPPATKKANVSGNPRKPGVEAAKDRPWYVGQPECSCDQYRLPRPARPDTRTDTLEDVRYQLRTLITRIRVSFRRKTIGRQPVAPVAKGKREADVLSPLGSEKGDEVGMKLRYDPQSIVILRHVERVEK